MSLELQRSPEPGHMSEEEAGLLVGRRRSWCHVDGTPGSWHGQRFSHGVVVYPEVTVSDVAAAGIVAVECFVVDDEGSVTSMPYLGVQATVLAYLRANGLLAHL
jgi:hypothetical protein